MRSFSVKRMATIFFQYLFDTSSTIQICVRIWYKFYLAGKTLVDVLKYKHVLDKVLGTGSVERISRFYPSHFLDQVLVQVLQ